MMLIQSPLSSSAETALSLTSGYEEEELMCDSTNGAKKWKGGPRGKHAIVYHRRSVQVTERKMNCSFSSNLSSSFQHSTVSTMSENCSVPFVYKRRKLPKGSFSACPAQASTEGKPGDNAEGPSVTAKEDLLSLVEVQTEAFRAPVVLPAESNRGAFLLSSASNVGCSLAEELDSVEDPKCDELKNVEACFVNDSCSSSKLNVDLCGATSRPEMDETGEGSSSDALVIDGLKYTTSEMGVIISIRTVLGINKAVWPSKTRDSPEGIGTNSNCISSLSCKVCDQLEMTDKMLICDQCDEAFHISCCNPRVKKIPCNEWFCHSCLKKRHKVLVSTSIESMDSNNEMSRHRFATSRCALGPIALILKENEPYTTNVRIGPEFQAEVPDWSGSPANEIDCISEPLEIYPSVGVHSQEEGSGEARRSSICNWVQCRQVMDGEGNNGTVCRKWRRAPLFELQTDNWECFRSFLWDPTHADCAVPQELDTHHVMKDLKYVEMLRPQLAAKRRKFGCSSSGSGGPEKGVRDAGNHCIVQFLSDRN